MGVQRTGATVGRLFDSAPPQDARAVLSTPCDSCGIEEYAAQLGVEGPELQVVREPYGERRSVLRISRRHHSVITIENIGWEGASYTVRIQGITREQGVALARRIFGLKATPPTSDPYYPGELVLHETDDFGAGAYRSQIRVRVHKGAVEIIGVMIAG